MRKTEWKPSYLLRPRVTPLTAAKRLRMVQASVTGKRPSKVSLKPVPWENDKKGDGNANRRG
mgnify:CR=1 FL=1